MNITLKQVIFTSANADKFFKLPEIYIRGNMIKYIRVPDEIIIKIRDEQLARREQSTNKRGRGAPRGRGRGSK
jgi:U6 snRNA-associated Sm-like protein LSm4